MPSMDAPVMSRESECLIPLMFDGRAVETKEGSEFGSFRPIVAEPIGMLINHHSLLIEYFE